MGRKNIFFWKEVLGSEDHDFMVVRMVVWGLRQKRWTVTIRHIGLKILTDFGGIRGPQ